MTLIIKLFVVKVLIKLAESFCQLYLSLSPFHLICKKYLTSTVNFSELITD